MDDILEVTGAYGRHYATATQALCDWAGGLDFKIIAGPYLSCRDTKALIEDGWSHVGINLVGGSQLVIPLNDQPPFLRQLSSLSTREGR